MGSTVPLGGTAGALCVNTGTPFERWAEKAPLRQHHNSAPRCKTCQGEIGRKHRKHCTQSLFLYASFEILKKHCLGFLANSDEILHNIF